MSTTRHQWVSVPLCEIADIERTAVSPENIKSGTNYVGLENMTSSGCFVAVDTVSNGDLASTKFAFTNKHILYGKLRPYLAKIGRPDFSGVCSTDILPILPGPMVDRGFLLHFLRQPQMVDYASSRTSGANLPRISPKALAEFAIPLPPLSEQKRIADILDKADAIRRKRREAGNLCGQVPAALFFEMFGDPHANPHGWPTKELSELVIADDKINYGVVQPGVDFSGGVPIVRVGDLQNLRVSVEELKRIDPLIEKDYARSRLVGDEVLIACVGSIGLVALADERVKGFNIVRAVARVRCSDAIDRLYLAAYLATPAIQNYFYRETRTVSQPTLNIKQIEETPIQIPPLELQRHFAKSITRQQEFLQRLEAATTEVNQLFNSLTQSAFREKL